MNYAKPLFLVASLTLAACSSAPGEVEEPVGSAQQAALSGNALSGNALSGNALSGNALSGNALSGNALSGNALSGNALSGNDLVMKDLEDPNAREVLKYIVGCALPGDESVVVTVQGTTYTFPGQLGLASEWGDGICDDTCQQWVSACVLSRVDYQGIHREISLRGSNPGLAVAPSEAADYTVREATYYGTIFASPQKLYACLAPGQTEDPRVCGPSLKGCIAEFDPYVTCDQVCDWATTDDGGFQNCRAQDGDWDDHPWLGSITVYLRPGEL